MQQLYFFNRNSDFLISVVEGIAGNDDQIIENYESIQPFTASLSYGKTGYGIMSVSS